MNYPFDIGFASAPGANDFVTFNTLTYAHNPTDGTIDLNVASTALGGLILKSTPPQGKLTFGAEVMFTANNTGTTNHFGLWLLNFPETTNYTGYRFANINNTTAPTGNKWWLTTSNSNLSAWVDFPFRQSGVPAFALNTWYDIRVEYDRKSFDTVGAATIKVWVNGVLIGEHKDIASAAAPVTPGIFLYAGKLKVRRMYGDLTPSVTAETPFVMTEPDRDRMISDFGEGKSATESKPDTQKTWWSNNNDLTIRGRVLTDSFQPIVENVYAFRGDSMEAVHQVETDDEGFYEMTKLDSKFDYVLMVKRDGRMKTIPMADYVGFGELAGAYRIRGENIGEVEVKVFSEQTGEYLGQVTTNLNGQFSIPNVNPNHLFTLVFREPTGAWEDRVSSRRIPELTAFVLQFDSSLHDDVDRIGGVLKVTNGHAPFVATSPNLKSGMSLVVNDDEIAFSGESVLMGPYSIPINVTSVDGGQGTYTHEGIGGYMRSSLWDGAYSTMNLQAELERSDPNFNLVKALLHFDSKYVNVSNSLALDVSPARSNWTISSGVVLDSVDKKFGDGSLKFAGNSGGVYNSGDDSYFVGDYTAEFWAKVDTTKTANQYLMVLQHINGWYTGIYVQSANKAIGFYSSGYGQIWTGQAANALTNNTWVHIALCRNGGTTTLYQNGVSIATTTVNYITSLASSVLLGSRQGTSTEALFGNIDDFRYTAGLCRYTANFTPPTKAYVDGEDQSK